MQRAAAGLIAALATVGVAAPAAFGQRRHHVARHKHTHHRSTRATDESLDNCPPGQSDPSYCNGPPVIDAGPVTGQTTNTATVKLTTPTPGDLIVAFVRADSPSSAGNTASVSGGPGLVWKRIARANAALGDSEVWVATAGGKLNSAAITATLTKYTGYNAALTVIAFSNASGISTAKTFSSNSGAPAGTLTTTTANTWVFAAGNDWLSSTPRTVGPAQTLQQQSFDSVGDTYWVQSTAAPTAAAGTPVTINDIAPTTDPFNLVLVDIV
jgi:hypothetical protein